jgi:hypothetical protein
MKQKCSVSGSTQITLYVINETQSHFYALVLEFAPCIITISWQYVRWLSFVFFNWNTSLPGNSAKSAFLIFWKTMEMRSSLFRSLHYFDAPFVHYVPLCRAAREIRRFPQECAAANYSRELIKSLNSVQSITLEHVAALRVQWSNAVFTSFLELRVPAMAQPRCLHTCTWEHNQWLQDCASSYHLIAPIGSVSVIFVPQEPMRGTHALNALAATLRHFYLCILRLPPLSQINGLPTFN